jgi:hypothetical protein
MIIIIIPPPIPDTLTCFKLVERSQSIGLRQLAVQTDRFEAEISII